MSTQIVVPTAATAHTARRTLSTVPNRVISVLPTPQLPGDQEERERHADRDGAAARDVRPNEPDRVLTGLDDHQDRGGEEGQHDVDRERPRGGRDLGAVEEVEQESAGVVEVRRVLAAGRDECGYRDRAVDGAEHLGR